MITAKNNVKFNPVKIGMDIWEICNRGRFLIDYFHKFGFQLTKLDLNKKEWKFGKSNVFIEKCYLFIFKCFLF